MSPSLQRPPTPMWYLVALVAVVAGCESTLTCARGDCDAEQAAFLADIFPVCAEKIASTCPDPASGCGCEIRDMVEPEHLVCEENSPGGFSGEEVIPVAFYKQSLHIHQVRVLGAFAAEEDPGGGWRRVCDGGGAASHALLDFYAETTIRSDDDSDRGLGPGDTFADGCREIGGGHSKEPNPAGGEGIDVEIRCAEPLGEARDETCSDQQVELMEVPTAGGGATSWEPERGDGHDVLVLVDMSGSTVGLVDADSYLETPAPVPAADFSDLASDFSFFRASTVSSFIEQFDAGDRVGVLAFGEGLAGQAVVPCAAGTLDACFGEDVEVWLDAAGVPSLAAHSAAGRANLWGAVATAMDFLEAAPDARASRHIIVVSDGPDTCQQGDDPFCSDVTFADISSRIRQSSSPIPLHFVQFEAIGYPGRDLEQIDAACASGGHYRFVNSEDMPRKSPTLAEALSDAIGGIRAALRGSLHVVVELADVGVEQAAEETLLLTGKVRLEADQWGLSSSASQIARSVLQFGTPGAGWAEDNPQLDDRLPLVLP